MKKFFITIVSICIFLSLTACGNKSNNNSKNETISKDQWSSMLAESNFENCTIVSEYYIFTYGISLDGTSADSASGAFSTGTNLTMTKMRSTTKITADKVSQSVLPEEHDSIPSNFSPTICDGEVAQAIKKVGIQSFKIMIEDYDNFTYDSATNTYKLKAPTTINKVMDYPVIDGNSVTYESTTANLDLHAAEISVSKDGKLLSVVCNYTTHDGDQDYNIPDHTWSFSDYGTTVIEDETNDGSNNQNTVPAADVVVSENFTVDTNMMQYIYSQNVNNFVSHYNMYISYFELDFAKSFKEQNLNDMAKSVLGMDYENWHDYFWNMSINSLKEMLCYYEDAKDDNYYDQHKEEIDQEVSASMMDLELNADAYGYDLAQYVKAIYGENVNVADVEKMMLLATISEKWAEANLDKIEQNVTDDQVITYCEENNIDMSDSSTAVEIGVIVIWKPQINFGNDQTREKIDSLKEEFISGDLTTDRFISLGNSLEDAGVYVYDNFVPQNGAATINAWAFDESRVAGDANVVEENQACYLLYFIDNSDTPIWLIDAKSSLVGVLYNDWVEEMKESLLQSIEIKENAKDMVTNIIVK